MPMTRAGCLRLREECKHLKEVERPSIVKDIATAREHGDLKENAEYHAAKERQGFIESRIAILDDALARCEIIAPKDVRGPRIAFGAHVTLMNTATDEEITYQLVGPMEADFDKGRISITSPIGKAMLSREVGDEVTVQTPGGKRVYEVLSLAYDDD